MRLDFEGYRHFHTPLGSGYALGEHFDALSHLLLTREGCAPLPGLGRGGLSAFTYPGGDGRLRVYRRGGVVRHLVKESYVLQNRALAEFKVHRALLQRGLPVAPLLGVVWNRTGPIFRGAIATGALVGRDLLSALSGDEAPPAAALAACGEMVRRFHDAGLHHADLNASNIFLSATGPYLLDLDRASLSNVPLGSSARAANLGRLRRSFQKHGIGEARVAALFGGYGGA